MTILNFTPTSIYTDEHAEHVLHMTTDQFITFYNSLPKMSQNSLLEALESSEYTTQQELDEELLNCDSFNYIEEGHGYHYMTEYSYTSEYEMLEHKLTKIKVLITLIAKIDKLKVCLR